MAFRTLDDVSIGEMKAETRSLDAGADRFRDAMAREGGGGEGLRGAVASAVSLLPKLPLYVTTSVQDYLFKREAEKKVVSKGEKGEVRE